MLAFRLPHRSALVAALAASFACLAAADAQAATFTVSPGAADAVDAAPADSACATAATGCTLRAAVQAANASSGADTIVLPSGDVANLTLGVAGDALPASGDLDVTETLTVQASGASPAIIDGGDVDRIFDVPNKAPAPNIVLTLKGVQLRNGRVENADGGAVRTLGTLALTDSRITSSEADKTNGTTDSGGGAIAVDGAQGLATIVRSRLDGNVATFGGAIANLAAVTIDRSTLDGNSSRAGEMGSGGAIRNAGTLDIVNSTFSGNADDGGNGGGFLISTGQVTIGYSTIAGNSSAYGSAVRNVNNSATSILVRASMVIGTCDFTALHSLAPHHNIGGGATCGLNHASDNPNGIPTLDALADNGGPTPTRRLASGVGINQIPAADCAPTVDQRGGKRPFGGACDVGAYETASLADVQLTGSVAPASAVEGGEVTYSYDVAVSGPDPATNVVLSDPLPAGTSFVSAGPGCTGPAVGSSGTVTCALGSVAPGAPEPVSIVVKADSVNPSLGNTASITQDQTDLTPASLTLTSKVTAPPCGTPGGGDCPPPPPCGTPGGGDCPPPPPCGTPGAADCPLPPLALTLTGVKASPAKFRAANGTRISFTLSRDARVTFAVKGPATTKRVCATKAGKRKCRVVKRNPVAGSFSANGKTGANTVSFAGKLKRKALRPGRYTITPTAVAGSDTVKAKAITVAVLKPKR